MSDDNLVHSGLPCGPECDVPSQLSPHYRAGAAAEDAVLAAEMEDAADVKTIADAHAKLAAELNAEDEAALQGLMSLQDRVYRFLADQPDVTDLDHVGDGFFGLRLAASGDVSIVVRHTSGQTLASGAQIP